MDRSVISIQKNVPHVQAGLEVCLFALSCGIRGLTTDAVAFTKDDNGPREECVE